MSRKITYKHVFQVPSWKFEAHETNDIIEMIPTHLDQWSAIYIVT